MTIRVRGLGKRYRRYDRPAARLRQFFSPSHEPAAEFWAIEDVSFELPRGTSLGVIGRNGSGKSTLLQLLCGTTKPTVGEIEVEGRIGALLELGSGFNPEFTGRENVFLNASLLGLTRKHTESAFDDIAEFAGIGAYIDQPVKTYSSGMLVRLAFAVQVQLEPDILIVDEALAVGDALFQKRCYQRIEALRVKGTSLLFVSHDEEAVRTLTERAMLLTQGRVTARGTSAEVLLAYRRQLHEQETAYLAHMASRMEHKSPRPRAAATPDATALSERLSFGDRAAEILSVAINDAEGRPCSLFYPDQRVRVRVQGVAHQSLEHLNVALRIRNKEGVKMYSWGTLNQDMHILAGLAEGEIFWRRRFAAGERFDVTFDWICGLGANLYEVQASISHEGKPYYSEQRMLHWCDEATFFSVALMEREYHFGGAVDLRMRALF